MPDERSTVGMTDAEVVAMREKTRAARRAAELKQQPPVYVEKPIADWPSIPFADAVLGPEKPPKRKPKKVPPVEPVLTEAMLEQCIVDMKKAARPKPRKKAVKKPEPKKPVKKAKKRG